MKKAFKFLTLSLAMLLVYSFSFAQVTTSSMSGKVTEKGEPVVGATVVATHTPSGTQYYSITDANGLYRIPNMRIGGPYEVEVSLLGYKPAKQGGAYLKLGENFVLNIKMQEEAIALDAVKITAEGKNPLLNADKNGTSTNISSNQLLTLPTISRGIIDFAGLTPQANGTSFGGRDNRMNTVTIDGAVFNNNFGLSTTQILPGGQAQPIALDALDEITVNLAPFDVKQSQFTGASINAVTKSGTNRFTGTAYTYQRPKSFTGDKVGKNKVVGAHDAKYQTYGATVGGPIVKNKLFFFLSGEYEKSTTPSGAWEPSTNGVADAAKKISRTTVADLQRMHDFLLNTYNYEAGSYQNFPNFTIKNYKILARIDWNISKNHKLTLRYNEVVGENDVLTNATSAPNPRGSGRISAQSIAFRNAWYGFENTVRSFTGELSSKFGKVSNNLLVSYTAIEDKRTSPSSEFPFVDIYKDGDQYMSFGYELFTYNNDVKNNTLSIKDNVQFDLGSHHITVGGSFDRLYFNNKYVREGTSYYRYNYNNTTDPATGIRYADGMEAFMAGATPTAFAVQYGYNKSVPGVELTFGMLSLFAQDEWNPFDNLKITYGVRFERPFYLNDLDPNYNVDMYGFNKWDKYTVGVKAKENYHITSGKWPKPKWQISPRIGFNWDVTGDRSIQVRGGVGLFSGFLPFVWFTNQPNGAGMVQSPEVLITNINTLAAAGIKFNPDFWQQIQNNPTLLPTNPGQLPASASFAEVDKHFDMPQVLKANIGIDFKLPYNFVLTLEELYSKDINAVMQKDLNMQYASGIYAGADSRPYWTSTARKINNGVANAMYLTNTSKGYQNSATIQLARNVRTGLSGSIAYTYTIAKDVTSNPGSTAASAWSSNPVAAQLNDPELGNSNFAVPHRVVGYLSYRFEWLKHFATTIGLRYTGQAQGRANWTYSNDMNGDGYTADLMYIPISASDIKFVDYTYSFKDDSGTHRVTVDATKQREAFQKLMDTNKYLKKHKGKYAGRFGYVEPWHNKWDLKIMQDIFTNFGTNRRFTLQASLDIINIGNLLNKNWGAYKSMGSQSYDNLRPLTFVKSEDGVPTFRLNASATSTDPQSVVDNFFQNNKWVKTTSTSSTWAMLFGLRLIF